MIRYKYIPSSEVNLLQAIKTAAGDPTGAFKGKDIALVGANLQATALPPNILIDPAITVTGYGDDQLDFIVKVKPGVGEEVMVESFAFVLNAYGMGSIFSGEVPDTAYTPRNKLERLALRSTKLGDVTSYTLAVSMSTKNIERARFRIRGVNYWAYRVIDSTSIHSSEGNTLTNTLHLLFKEKNYDSENLFSEFVGETLGGVDGVKFLDLIADLNLSGTQLGGVTLASTSRGQPAGVVASMLDVEAGTVLDTMDIGSEWYGISTLSTNVYFKRDEVKQVHVIYKDNWKYQLDVHTSTCKISLLYG